MQSSPARYFRTLSILHIALCAGVGMFAGVVLLLKYVIAAPASAPELQSVLLPVAAGTALVSIAAAILLYKKRLAAIRNMARLSQKLSAYRAAQLLRWALLEGGVMIGLIGLMLTMNIPFMIIVAVPFALMIGSRPARAAGIAEMGLSWEEVAAWESGEVL